MTKRARNGGLRDVTAEDAGWLDLLPAAAVVLSPDGRIRQWNAEAALLLDWGQSQEPHLGTIYSPWLIRLQGAVETHGRGRAVISRRRRGGPRVTLELCASAYGQRDMLVLLRDCTPQMADRRRRQEDELRLRQFLDRLPEPVVIEQFGAIAYANPAAAAFIGVPVHALEGKPTSCFIAPEIQKRISSVLHSESGAASAIEASVQRADGSTAVAEVAVSPLHYRRHPAVQLLLRDVTAHREAEAGLRSTHERLRLISDVVRDHALLMLDGDSHIVSWNDSAERLMGYRAAEIERVHVAVLLTSSPDEVAALLDRANSEGRVELETEIRRKDASRFPAHITITALGEGDDALAGFGVIVRDLTERQRAEENLRRSEEQLRHAQKMDAVGRLASGIAHDFNNVLTAIQGHVQFLIEDLPPDLPSRDDAEEIKKAADRATELTRQLLTFARKQPSRPVYLSPNVLITDIEKLLRRLIRADVTLETALQDVPNVLIDPGQLEQVIVNLVVNARDAIGQAGRISITTSSIRLEEIYSARGLDLTPGQYVQVAVSDTGVGMSPDTQQQVFEPFFTTKPEGTGLGLSTVYGIVKQAGGHISVYSEPGLGTTFKVYLPVHEPMEEAPVPQRTGNEVGTVLLVEDDEAVRSLARRTLEGKGYSVFEAADGEEALRIAQTGGEIDVVVTDLTMPRLNGEELALRIRETQPDAGIVLMSGFSERSLVREGRIEENGYFLEKPFTPAALVDVVRAAMHQEEGQSSTKSA
ncbi:MAG TPA: PAS domain S-box protein [Longimicrobiales bacterium]